MHTQINHRAISMCFVAYLDEHRVEIRIDTESGQMLAVSCPRASILHVQRSIERMGRDCPEIASWGDGPADQIITLDDLLRAPDGPKRPA